MNPSIIDIHIHPICSEPHLLDAAAAAAPHYGVTTICLLGDVLAFGDCPSEDEIQKINNNTIEIVNINPDLYLGFCYLNPEHSGTFINAEIERCVCEHGFRGIKLEVAVKACDKRLDPVMEKACELDIPVLHHAWYKTVGQGENESTPADIAVLASRHPETTIIMAHIIGCGIRGIEDVKQYTNVYFDTSGSQPEAGIIEYAVREIGSERILYGSDVPYRDFSAQIAKVTGAEISESQKKDILFSNAQKLLGIEV
ncbi:amidohydrolase family protein [Planctomycetota bacterium]